MAAVLVVDFLVGVVRPVPGKSMKNFDTFFDDSDRKRIREAVTEAETHTSAEIVPVLTESSGRYDRADSCRLRFVHWAAESLLVEISERFNRRLLADPACAESPVRIA